MALTHKQEIAVDHRWSWDRVVQHLPVEDRTLITNALRLAAEQYRQDAIASAETPRVADQFTLQADLCEQIAGHIEL